MGEALGSIHLYCEDYRRVEEMECTFETTREVDLRQMVSCCKIGAEHYHWDTGE